MELVDICCSFKYAKKLDELGIIREPIFYWIAVDGEKPFIVNENIHLWDQMHKECKKYPAYTASELKQLYPIKDQLNRFNIFAYYRVVEGILEPGRNELSFIKYYLDDPDLKSEVVKTCNSHNEANARAIMLIYLLEEGFLPIIKIHNFCIEISDAE